MSILTNLAFFHAKPGRSEDLGSQLMNLVAPTRQEPGCLRYDIYRSKEDPNGWFVYEDWRSQADFDSHMQTSYVTSFMKRVPELCEGDVEICTYEMRSAETG